MDPLTVSLQIANNSITLALAVWNAMSPEDKQRAIKLGLDNQEGIAAFFAPIRAWILAHTPKTS